MSNWASFLVSTLVALAMSPYVLGKIGELQFGFWSLVVAVTGYYGFIDLGIRSAVGQYVTRYIARKEFDSLNDTVNTSLLVMAVIGFFIAVVAVVISLFLPQIINIDAANAERIRLPLLIVGLSIAIKFPFTVFQAAISGKQRFDLLGISSIGIRLGSAGLAYAVLEAGWGLLGLAIGTAVTQLTEGAVMTWIALRINPELRISPFTFSRKAFQEVRNYGVFSFLINVSDKVIFYTDTLIISTLVNPVAVTYYVIGSNLMPYFDDLVNAVGNPLMQVATAYDAGNQEKSLQSLFLTGTRYVFCFACLISVGIFTVGENFLGQWMGFKYVRGGEYGSSGMVMFVLAIAHTLYLSQAVSRQIIFGRRKNKFLAFVNMGEGVVNLTLALILVPRIGIIGVAYAALIPMLVTQGLLLPIFVSRLVGTNYFRFLWHSILPNVGALLITIAVSKPLLAALPASGWNRVIVSAMIVTVIYLSVIFVVVLEKKLRQRLLAKIGLGRVDRSTDTGT